MPFFSRERVRTCYLSQHILIIGHSRCLMQFWPNDLSFGSFEVILGQIRFFISNVWQNRDRALEMVPMCFSCIAASTDIQYDLLVYVTSRDLDLRSKTDIELFRSITECPTRLYPGPARKSAFVNTTIQISVSDFAPIKQPSASFSQCLTAH